MRIVLTSVHCWPDVRRGGERYVHELAAALLRAGHHVRVVSTGRPPRRDRVLDVPVRRLPVRRLPGNYPHPWEDVSVEAAFGLDALAHLLVPALTRRFDVWHATSTSDGAAAAATGAVAPRLRTVFTDHGFPARRSRTARPDRRQHSFLVKRIDSYVCVSQAAGKFLYDDYGRLPAVVPPGVRFSLHEPAARSANPVVVYSGSLDEPRKNVGLLVDAFGTVVARHPRAELWLLGPGDARPLLDAAPAAVRDAVTRTGVVDDAALRLAYAQAWVTALPSHGESFGMAVVESLASGTPAVVLESGGGPAEIVDNPAIGRRCESAADDIASGIEACFDLAQQAGTVAACRERARSYDWDLAVVPAMLEVYDGSVR